MKTPEMVTLTVALMFLLIGWGKRSQLLDAIEYLKDNFRGGPPTPMHPLPSNDGALLQSKRVADIVWKRGGRAL